MILLLFSHNMSITLVASATVLPLEIHFNDRVGLGDLQCRPKERNMKNMPIWVNPQTSFKSHKDPDALLASIVNILTVTQRDDDQITFVVNETKYKVSLYFFLVSMGIVVCVDCYSLVTYLHSFRSR